MRFVFQTQSIGRGGWVGGKLNVQKQERKRKCTDSPTKTNICEQTIKNDKNKVKERTATTKNKNKQTKSSDRSEICVTLFPFSFALTFTKRKIVISLFKGVF